MIHVQKGWPPMVHARSGLREAKHFPETFTEVFKAQTGRGARMRGAEPRRTELRRMRLAIWRSLLRTLATAKYNSGFVFSTSRNASRGMMVTRQSSRQVTSISGSSPAIVARMPKTLPCSPVVTDAVRREHGTEICTVPE